MIYKVTDSNCEVSWNGKKSRRYIIRDITTGIETSWSDFKDKKQLQILCAKLNITPKSKNSVAKMKDCLRDYFNTKSVPFKYSTAVSDNQNMSEHEKECNTDHSLSIASSTPERVASHSKDITIDVKCNPEIVGGEENNETKVCLRPKCKQCVSSNRTYCGRFHNKCEFLFDARKKYTLHRDEVGIYLTTLILTESDGTAKNPLQPQLNACAVPHIPEFNNLNELLEFFWPYRDILHCALGKKNNGKDNKGQSDQKIRAEHLYKFRYQTLKRTILKNPKYHTKRRNKSHIII